MSWELIRNLTSVAIILLGGLNFYASTKVDSIAATAMALLKGRKLTETQYASLVSELAALRVKKNAPLNVYVASTDGDAETERLAAQFATALRTAGYPDPGMNLKIPITTRDTGLKIDDAPHAESQEFHAIFVSVGLDVVPANGLRTEIAGGSRVGDGELLIGIWPQPTPR